ncbi:iron-containing alcohol dehydrogenase [Sporanaerobacter acetigenes]|uniref:Alcohol dehydrogenase, class IV n=1 Tax=Sporanaerobacter acetigenes DSM 13106 TaxID=1123281 RepID=A0A1M5VL71_9FIRM|nr:iron-containing alcohol dehydrogenase [Sporanaerobacter acetigenes]SHH75928.1 Alcohol dehydrogenase, class IV [Sporanaerobacter acetigenes DSM 13106]
MNLKNFYSVNAIFGEGTIEHLQKIEKNHIAILMGGKSQQSVVDAITDKFDKLGKEWRIVGNIKREPHMEDIEKPLKEVIDFKPDCILAIGGGSVMDSAKAIWIFYEYPNLKWDDVILPNPVPKLGNKAILIAIPTTSGTGSETSSCAVVVDKKKMEKKLIISQNILPTLAILDTQLACTMPKHVAANSGMDAFTHALESATSNMNNSIVQRISLVTLLDIFKYLPTSINGAKDSKEFKEAREKIHIASYLAGIAINNAGTGLAHIFDQVGPKLNIPHGLTCAILLPYTIEFTEEHPFYLELAKVLGYKEEKGYARFLAQKIIELNKSVGIPPSFSEMGIGEKEYLEAMKEDIETSINSGGLQFAAKVPTYEDAEKFMLKAYYGK